MEHLEWPTKTRLEDLRAEGLVSYSPLASHAVGTLAVIATLMGLRERFGALIALSRQGLQVTGARHFIGECVVLLAVPSIVYAVVVLLTGLLQTRFLLRVASVSLYLGHLNPVKRASPLGLLGRPFTAFLATAAIIFLGGVSFWFLSPHILSGLNQDLQQYLVLPGKVVQSAMPGAVVLLLVLALFGWGWSWFIFMWKYRMPRKDVEREAREG